MVVKYIKLSDLLKDQKLSPFLIGAFLSRIMEKSEGSKHFFYAYSSFRASKTIHFNEFDFEKYASKYIEELNDISGYKNWVINNVSESKIDVRFYVLNDRFNEGFTRDQLYSFMHKRSIEISTGNEFVMSGEAKDFIRGFIELRGSVDTSAKFISDDFFGESKNELKKPYILTDMMGIPIDFVNFNPRNLQPQYVSGVNRRNPQLRMNVFYYAKNIGFINDYKAKIFERAYSSYIHGKREVGNITYYNVDLPKENGSETFRKRLNFFSNNLYERNITPYLVERLRNQMGLKNDTYSNKSESRDQLIIGIYKEISPDKCAICGTSETFLDQKTGRQYFEIHHVISYKNGKEVDNIANLVKLCPTCHRMMGKGKANRDEQIKANIKILHNSPEVFDFVASYFGTDDINELAELICDNAG